MSEQPVKMQGGDRPWVILEDGAVGRQSGGVVVIDGDALTKGDTADLEWARQLAAGVGLTDFVAACDARLNAARGTWPLTSAERVAFADWRYEAGNGDTILGFRDWVEHRDELDGA